MKNETIISLRQLVESAIDCASKIDLKETKNNPDVFVKVYVKNALTQSLLDGIQQLVASEFETESEVKTEEGTRVEVAKEKV